MTTSKDRMKAFRKREKAAGLAEVRGIKAPPKHHQAIKSKAKLWVKELKDGQT